MLFINNKELGPRGDPSLTPLLSIERLVLDLSAVLLPHDGVKVAKLYISEDEVFNEAVRFTVSKTWIDFLEKPDLTELGRLEKDWNSSPSMSRDKFFLDSILRRMTGDFDADRRLQGHVGLFWGLKGELPELPAVESINRVSLKRLKDLKA